MSKNKSASPNTVATPAAETKYQYKKYQLQSEKDAQTGIFYAG
jgi:hypothetical protein